MELSNKLQAQQFEIKNFTYDLPENKIAKYPLAERDLSKLLVYNNERISEDIYRNLDKYINEKSLLVFNNTKVIQARLHFSNSKGGKIEIFCLEPSEENHEPSAAMLKNTCVEWKCLIGRVGRWKEKVISIKTSEISLDAEILKKSGNVFTIRFSWQPTSFSFAEILQQLGEMPIPPYLKRESEGIDVKRYQTVYATQQGSVAAPTAGLHFTKEIFEKLKAKNAIVDYVTLHVGAGTFIPVKSETLEGHEMHFEWIEVEKETIAKIAEQISNGQTKKNVIAIGTTSLRTIETLYWMGVKANQSMSASMDELEVKQWDSYELQQSLTASDSLNCLLAWLKRNKIEKLICKTQLLIVPSYKLRIANALITNFHQPSSTLLLLVAAVVGDDWKMIYDYALENDFRFLSYGDGSLLFDHKQNSN
jgi:S-adenosylmethionine:tRNA ribosyltransferase-isomerase